ncbi:hypothetical protein AAIA72_07185 [Hahella sp. SMD15-11]|uniref:Alpha/beta hydrolase n=1 Tax=Thermohahella caldifontis TaxID=3142973 RepID=A0AB39V0B3_9GAMM
MSTHFSDAPECSRLSGIARIWLVLVVLCLATNTALAAYLDKSLNEGKVRIHYVAQTPATCDAILLGVGTAMQTSSYDKLSTQLAGYGYLVVIMDHAPGEMVKTDANKYTALALAVKNQLISWLGSRTACRAVGHWVLGGALRWRSGGPECRIKLRRPGRCDVQPGSL